jgi:hypothetical protein
MVFTFYAAECRLGSNLPFRCEGGKVRLDAEPPRRQTETLLECPVFTVGRPLSNARRIRGSRGRDVVRRAARQGSDLRSKRGHSRSASVSTQRDRRSLKPLAGLLRSGPSSIDPRAQAAQPNAEGEEGRSRLAWQQPFSDQQEGDAERDEVGDDNRASPPEAEGRLDPARCDKGGSDQQDDRAEEPLVVGIEHRIRRPGPLPVGTRQMVPDLSNSVAPA